MLSLLAGPALALPPMPLNKSLETGAKGRSVVLTWSRDGILATTLDGKFRKRLYDKPVDSATLDSLADLLWFVADQKLQVLDLRATSAEPVVVVTGFTSTDFIVQGIGSAFTTQESSRFLHVLQMANPPLVSVRPPTDGSWNEAENQKALGMVKTAQVVGQAWLNAQTDRKAGMPPAPGTRLPPPPPPPGDPRNTLDLPDHFKQCNDASQCGRNLPLGKSGLRLVVVYQNCAGGCVKQCALVDAAGKVFNFPAPVLPKDAKPGDFPPPSEPTLMPCGPVMVNAKSDAWIVGNKVCTKVGCQTVEGTPFAWVGLNERVDLR
jgi:hypothetical protein